jgi:hypothetical protein
MLMWWFESGSKKELGKVPGQLRELTLARRVLAEQASQRAFCQHGRIHPAQNMDAPNVRI